MGRSLSGRRCATVRRRPILRAIWAILCKDAIVDKRSNNISLIQVLDEFMIPAPPPEPVTDTDRNQGILFDANLVVLWTRSDLNTPERAQMRSKIVAPNGSAAESVVIDIDLTDIITRARSIGHIAVLPHFTQEGEYVIRIEMKSPDSDWEEAFELPLWVNIQQDTPC